jgi:hypothetical protein
LEIDFVGGEPGARGLRALTRATIDELCTAAKCTVISTLSNDHFDSYVLSESSLFVYPLKVIILTCGRTTPLHCLTQVIAAAAALDLHVEWLQYSRKNFNFPLQQPSPPIPDARVLNGGSSRRNTRGERLWHDVCRVVRAPPLATPVGLFRGHASRPPCLTFPFFSFPRSLPLVAACSSRRLRAS